MTVAFGQPGWGAPRRRTQQVTPAEAPTVDVAALLSRRRGAREARQHVTPDDFDETREDDG